MVGDGFEWEEGKEGVEGVNNGEREMGWRNVNDEI